MGTPGPGVLSLAGVGSAYGFRNGVQYLLGLLIGNALTGLIVVSGLAATILAIPYMRTILLFASVGYLLYLAMKIALAGSRVAFIFPDSAPGFFSGITLQIINPKAYVVNTAFFSAFPLYPDNFLYEVMIKFFLINCLWIPIHFAWLTAGVSLKKLALEERTQRLINILMAVLMLVAVAIAAIN